MLSPLLAPIPSRYSIDLWDIIRLMLCPDPAERPTIDEILAMPSVSVAQRGISCQHLGTGQDGRDVQRSMLPSEGGHPTRRSSHLEAQLVPAAAALSLLAFTPALLRLLPMSAGPVPPGAAAC